MKQLLLAASAIAFLSSPAFAQVKTYQVTGPVTALDGETITVKKGDESWQLAKGTANVPAKVAVGSKVTIKYTMTAQSIEDKGAAKDISATNSEAKPAKKK